MRKLWMAAAAAASIGLAVAPAAAASAAPAAHAAVAAKRGFANCDLHYFCIYPNNNGTGGVTEYNMASSQINFQWFDMGQPRPGSAFVNGDSSVEVWNAQSGFHECITHGQQVILNSNFGKAYVNYGHANSCAGVPDFN